MHIARVDGQLVVRKKCNYLLIRSVLWISRSTLILSTKKRKKFSVHPLNHNFRSHLINIHFNLIILIGIFWFENLKCHCEMEYSTDKVSESHRAITSHISTHGNRNKFIGGSRQEFLTHFKIKIERISVLSWKPTSHKASRNLSALKIPVFSFVCILNTPCLFFENKKSHP